MAYNEGGEKVRKWILMSMETSNREDGYVMKLTFICDGLCGEMVKREYRREECIWKFLKELQVGMSYKPEKFPLESGD